MEATDVVTQIVSTVLALGLVGSVAWLIKKVLYIEKEYVSLKNQFEERHIHIVETIKEMKEHCVSKHIEVADLHSTIIRLDRNIVRLCQSGGIEYEKGS